jgi:mRNA interferase MazF
MRGDLVTVVLTGDYGKPGPALIIQSDVFRDVPSTTVLPLSSTLMDLPHIRIPVDPTPANGLLHPSQVMLDKATTVRNDKVGPVFGRLNDETMTRINRAIALFFGLG